MTDLPNLGDESFENRPPDASLLKSVQIQGKALKHRRRAVLLSGTATVAITALVATLVSAGGPSQAARFAVDNTTTSSSSPSATSAETRPAPGHSPTPIGIPRKTATAPAVSATGAGVPASATAPPATGATTQGACRHTSTPLAPGQTQSLAITVQDGHVTPVNVDANGQYYKTPSMPELPDGDYSSTLARPDADDRTTISVNVIGASPVIKDLLGPYLCL